MSETTIYVGGILEKITKSGSTTWRHRIEGPGGLLAIVNCSGSSCNPTATTNYIHRDHLGSPELITNSSGTEVVKLSFGAFGERRDRDWHGVVSSSDMTAIGNATRRGFTEHEHLDSVGLVHMNGRVYDPMLGRFLSSDPIEDGLGRPGGFNRYAYVSNRPLTLTDPSGYGDGWTKHFDFGFPRWLEQMVLKDWALDLEASQGGGLYTGPLPPLRPPTGQPPPTSSPPAGPPAGPQPPGTSPPEPAVEKEPQGNQQKRPCGKVAEGQISVGADAAFFGHGANWSAGPGANTAGQVFWRGTAGSPTSGWGVKLSAGLSGSLSLSTSIVPPGMVENWLPTGTIWEIQGNFVIGGGCVIGRSPDGSSLTFNLKPSVGFAVYVGEGTTTDSTIAGQPITCKP